jgi:predicted DNA-binding transcriptional regulator AlpA
VGVTHLHRIKHVVEVTGLSRKTIQREIAADRFPRPVHPTAMTTAWRSDELQAWLDALPRGKIILDAS